MTRIWKQLGSLLVGFGLTTACQPLDEAEDFRNGIPRSETVAMTVPEQGGGQALTVESHQRALRGETSDFYKLTRGVSGLVNGGGALVLGLVKAVVAHPPTEVGAATAVWGPWTEPLAPNAWKVTVTHEGGHRYRYVFEGRDKHSTGAFVTVLSGTHTAALDPSGRPMEGFGAGMFTLDWDARATLPMPDDEVGSATYVYSRQPGAPTTIEAQFRNVKDKELNDQRVNVDYLYQRTPGAGGRMEFVHAAPAGMTSAGTRWAVLSRWAETGAGRSDVRATGGDIPDGSSATASECWDVHFSSAFLASNFAAWTNYGDEATDCVFQPAEYPGF